MNCGNKKCKGYREGVCVAIESEHCPDFIRADGVSDRTESAGSVTRKIRIEGYDDDGKYVDLTVRLKTGTITENGHCRFVGF